MADVTTAGADVIVHLVHLLGQRKAKNCSCMLFISPIFTICVIMGWCVGIPTWCLAVYKILQNLRIFAVLPVYQRGTPHYLRTCVHQVVLELYHKYIHSHPMIVIITVVPAF